MPIYEYQGQQYDIATEDHAVAKAKILSYLGTQGNAPAPKPTQAAASDDFDFGSPMGTGAEEIMAQTSKPRKVYTGSVFDTQPFNPSANPAFDPMEAERMSRRAYAEAQAAPERRVQEMRATPKDVLERSALKAAGDTTIGLLQGMVSLPKSIVDNIPFDNPLSQFYKDAYEAGEKSKSGYLRSKNVERSANLENIRKNQGELAATRASFSTMFSPSGADVVAQGTGSLVPTTGLSMLNLGLKSMTAMNVLANAGDAAQQTAAKLADMSPEQWSNSAAYQALREKGLNHTDAVRMLAPLYALPSQIMGGITGAVSGATGLEKALVKGGAKTARARAGRAGAELLGEEFESLAPEFTGNVTRRLLDDKASLLDGLGQTAVETLFGTLPGAGLAAAASKGQGKQAPAATRVEPTLAPQETQPAVPPTVAPTPPAPPTALSEVKVDQAAADRRDRINAATEQLEQMGIPTDNAKGIATRQVDAALTAEAKTAAIKIPEGRVEEITQDLISAGVAPQQAAIDAQNLAQEEAQADAQARAEGAQDVTRPNAKPDRTSVPVAEPAAPVASATGEPTGAERNGVVPVEQNVGEPVAGEVAEPATVAEAPAALAETKDRLVTTHDGKPWTYFFPGAEVVQMQYAGAPAKVVGVEETRGQPTTYELEVDVSKHPDGVDDNGDRVNTKTVWVTDDELNRFNPPNEITAPAGEAAVQAAPAETIETQAINPPTEGVNLAPETIETQQAEAQQQEAPAAAGVTPAKRGRPAVQQTHVVAENPEGGFNHVANGEVVAAYANKKQATAAVNLAKAQDKGSTELVAKNQAKLDAALASQGRGRPAGVKVEGKEKAESISQEDKVEINALESALDTYNSPDSDGTQIKLAAGYVHDVANDKTAPEKARARARQMLEEDIDPKDLPRNKRALPSKFANAPANTRFSKVTNASEAVGLIADTGTLFQKEVAKRLRNSVVGIKFVVLEEGDAIPSEMDNARGLFEYNPGTNKHVIYVRGASFGDMQGINNVTVLHELLHAATAKRIEAGLFGGTKNAQLTKFMDEMQTLMKRVEAAYESGVRRGIIPAELQDLVEADAENTKYDENDNPKFEIFNSPHEFLAYGMSSDEFQRFLMRIRGTRTSETGFSKFVNTIRDLFSVKPSEATAFTDLVNITDDVLNTNAGAAPTQRQAFQQKKKKFTPPVFDEKEDIRARRSAKKLARDTQIAKAKVAASREGNIDEATKEMQEARDPNEANNVLARFWTWASYGAKEQLVKLPTFDVLAKLAADKGVPALMQVDTQLGQMLGMSQKFLGGASQMIDMLKRGFKEDPNLDRAKFENFVYETTLAEIDPSDPNAVERNKNLDKDYKDLGPVGQRMYKQLKSYYESIIELYSDLLDAQISNIQGMSPEEKSNLMLVLRKTFEAKARITPFFPLVRRGDYWLAIGEGADRKFYMFESRFDRNNKAKELAARQGDSLEDLLFQQKFEQGNDLGSLRAASKDSSAMLKQVFEAIDKMDFGAEGSNAATAKEGLKDAVYQVYLTTMPEQSFRRQFTHRKGRTGFSTDLQRNIATTASKQAIQLSRLKYAPMLRNALSQARDSIREREELSPFVQEAEKRINLALSGQSGGLGEAVAGVANKASYFWYLSGVSSALIQPASVFISGLPILAANHNNATGAGLELAKMATLVNQYSVFRKNIDGTTSLVAPSLANNKSLPADERKAVSEMVSRGVTQSTYASLVWGYKSMSTEAYEGIRGKGKQLANLMVGALMHNTERLSREAVYLASYRLGRKRGLSYDEAVQQAADDTNEALGNYDITNRPRYMQQGLGKVAFQFKMYPLQMTLLMLTNFKKMLPFLNKEGKKEAVTKFFGMMGTSFLAGGAANMALFSPIMGLLGWAWSAMGKDDDWPEDLKSLSFETWFKTVFLPEKLGDISVGGVPLSDLVERGPVNALTGWEIGSRIGLNDLWGRDSKETKTSRDSAIAFMLDRFGGPTVSLGLSFADAYDAYAMGDYQKMTEKLLPAALRNLVVTNRMANEGMKTARGMELVAKDDVKMGELIGQAIGFQPDLLSATQVNSFKLTGIEQRIVNQRTMILNKLDFEHRKDTDEGDERFERIMDTELPKFNAKYPSYGIDPDAIIKSLELKAEQRAGARAGVVATEKNVPLIEEATDTMEARLDKRAAEMKARREKAK